MTDITSKVGEISYDQRGSGRIIHTLLELTREKGIYVFPQTEKPRRVTPERFMGAIMRVDCESQGNAEVLITNRSGRVRQLPGRLYVTERDGKLGKLGVYLTSVQRIEL